MKRAIITGICGQDGAYLAKYLLSKGYNVIGWARRNTPTTNLEYLGVKEHLSLRWVDICDVFHVEQEIRLSRPDEIYNLAAQSHVGQSFNNPSMTCQINYSGYLNVLLSARKFAPDARIYQAGTSEMFGYSAYKVDKANEETPFAPMSPYAISKVAAHWAGVNARYEAQQFIANGILFNHESPLRGDDFVTKKITNFVKNPVGILELGNLDSKRDWGSAEDYVKAMYMMLQHDQPDDFVVATGETTSVRDFVTFAFRAIGKEIEFSGSGLNEFGVVDGEGKVKVRKEFYRPNDLSYLCGDFSKISSVLGWRPEANLQKIIREMVNG